jgi:hypothetical protein
MIPIKALRDRKNRKGYYLQLALVGIRRFVMPLKKRFQFNSKYINVAILILGK